ncbi:MAG: rane protein [Marmoricola sp.]|nr:rane protein [Marmoricola sp.]
MSGIVEDTAVPEPVSRARNPWTLAVAGLAVALVVALVLLGLTVRSLHHERDLAHAGTQADVAARKAVVEMTTYDYKTIPHDFSWVDDAGTARFRKQYAEVSSPIKKLVAQLKAHAVGTVVDSATSVKDADHVSVLLFVDQTLTNPTQSQPGLDQPRVTMSMVRVHGRWLVDQVKLNNLTASQ